MSFAAKPVASRSAVQVRQQPEQILLQLVERYYPEFALLMAQQGSPLPGIAMA